MRSTKADALLMWVIIAAAGRSDVTIRLLSLFLHHLRFCLIEAADRFDGHSKQCPRRQKPPTPEPVTPTCLELPNGTRRVSCRLLSFTRRLERPSFPPHLSHSDGTLANLAPSHLFSSRRRFK